VNELWQQQWELFAPNFHDGKAHIDLGHAGQLLLLPGAGFGDLSHPTTRLMLRMMEGKLEGKTVLDIGCGSGILSLAAAKMGAREVFGVDIDPEAVEHANKNLALNGLGQSVQFSLAPLEAFVPKAPLIVLMNMIPTEQEAAWEAHAALPSMKRFIITSGVLSEALPAYLQWAAAQGWTLIDQIEENNWHCQLFSH